MRRPRIGIPLSLDDRGRWRADRAYHYIDRSYADATDRAGGSPLHLPIQRNPADVVAGLDGLLIPGGGDFPSQSTLPAGVELDLVPSDQLAFDEALLSAACERGIPVLGICYGMQLMARARGGSLDTHLPSQRPEAGDHRLPVDRHHPIEIESNSLLASVLGISPQSVNSLHHQAVGRLGPGHRAVAFAADGVIEAIERAEPTGGPVGSGAWELGVQWHPEKMGEDSSSRLFGAFIEACRPSGIVS